MRLNFHVQGDGVPLIVPHGFLGSSDNWRAMSKRFAADYKVDSLDLRNHGASPHSPVMSYAAMADDLREFFASEKIDRTLEGQIPDVPVRQFLIKNLARGADPSIAWRIGLAEIVGNYDELTKAIVVDGAIVNPTCFIRAGRSSFIAEGDIPLIRQMFLSAQIVTIADAGHWVHIDAADEFYRAVTGFLLADGR